MSWLRLWSVVALAVAFWAGSACDARTPQGAAPSPSVSGIPAGSPLASPSGKLGAEVAMPSGFPADFPIYRGARLTAENSVPGSGSTKWSLEWQTLDTVSSVQPYFVGALDKNDWILLGYSGDINARFSATFTRKSNHTLTNSLEVTNRAGLTKIDLVLNSIP